MTPTDDAEPERGKVGLTTPRGRSSQPALEPGVGCLLAGAADTMPMPVLEMLKSTPRSQHVPYVGGTAHGLIAGR